MLEIRAIEGPYAVPVRITTPVYIGRWCRFLGLPKRASDDTCLTIVPVRVLPEGLAGKTVMFDSKEVEKTLNVRELGDGDGFEGLASVGQGDLVFLNWIQVVEDFEDIYTIVVMLSKVWMAALMIVACSGRDETVVRNGKNETEGGHAGNQHLATEQ